MREVASGERHNARQKWALLKPHFDGVKLAYVDAKFLLALPDTSSLDKTRDGKPVRPPTLRPFLYREQRVKLRKFGKAG